MWLTHISISLCDGVRVANRAVIGVVAGWLSLLISLDVIVERKVCVEHHACVLAINVPIILPLGILARVGNILELKTILRDS